MGFQLEPDTVGKSERIERHIGWFLCVHGSLGCQKPLGVILWWLWIFYGSLAAEMHCFDVCLIDDLTDDRRTKHLPALPLWQKYSWKFYCRSIPLITASYDQNEAMASFAVFWLYVLHSTLTSSASSPIRICPSTQTSTQPMGSEWKLWISLHMRWPSLRSKHWR